MDKYMERWVRLVRELEHLDRQEVTSIHPVIVLGYMSFIKDAVEHEQCCEKGD